MKVERGYGVFAAGNYDKLTKAEVATLKNKAKKLGLKPDQVDTLFPEVTPRRPELPTAAKDKYGVEVPSYMGPGGRKAYDDAVTAKARNKVRYQDLVNTLKKVYKGKNEKQVLATPEGIKGLEQILAEPKVEVKKSRFDGDFD